MAIGPETRSHTHEESFDVAAERMFDLLITPSAIRQWWGASRAIVDARKDGIWTASWGEEDDPDFISSATLVEFDPPRRMSMKFGHYYAKSGSLPFKFADDALASFEIETADDGCILRAEQTGFPCEPAADEFFAACELGWKNTFLGIRQYIANAGSDK